MKFERRSRLAKTAKLAATLGCTALVTSANFSQRAYAYGPEGHRIVGSIADELLKGTPTATKLGNLLEPGETLASVSTWADVIKGGNLQGEAAAFVENNPNHRNYHFSDVPFQIHHYSPVFDNEIKRGVNGQDVEHMMQTCIHILRGDAEKDPTLNPTHITPHVALKLLVHYAGDIHQPLHVGAAYIGPNNNYLVPQSETDGEETAGGNHFDTDFLETRPDNGRGNTRNRPRPVNLHHFWDTDTVVLRMQQNMAQFMGTFNVQEQYGRKLAQDLTQPHPDWDNTDDPINWPLEWANDILPLSEQAYSGLVLTEPHQVNDQNDARGFHLNWSVHLSQQYIDAAEDATQLELQKGGYRLAKLLTAILP